MKIPDLKSKIHIAPGSLTKGKTVGFYLGFGLVFLFSVLLRSVCKWSVSTFGVGLDEIIFTLTAPLKGSDSNVALEAVRYCLPSGLFAVAAIALLTAVGCILKKTVILELGRWKVDFRKIFRVLVAVAVVVNLIVTCVFVNNTYDVVGYISQKLNHSTVYEDNYVDPQDLTFSFSGEKKNLVYIYLESMETTYASKDVGGFQSTNYIPNLTQLATEGVSFSDSDRLGGFVSATGTGYTMGALLAATSGVHFGFPVSGNDMSKHQKFAPGLYNMGDVLNDLGYNQEFLCGSDAEFAGRKIYFQQHGNYKIFDLFSAQEKGYVEEEDCVFWGYLDFMLYEIAKDELTELAAQNAPFNLTMLTVDTHHVSGYICEKCKNDYDSQTANVVACADRQLSSFLDWLKQQPFYEDTVVVITGDHPRMDTDLVGGVAYTDRTIYNCILNSPTKVQGQTQNRDFTTMDMFPTTLSALGIEWGGSKLGLGTDMFSGEQTLLEEMGYEALSAELKKNSRYFAKHFQ